MGKRLTVQQELFVHELLKDPKHNQVSAYKKAYPNSQNWKSGVNAAASKLANDPKIKARFDELFDEFVAREKEKTGWTREQAIEHLQFVITANRRDLERIEQAAEDELEFLAEQIEKNPEMALELTQEMLKKRQKTRANMTNNTGIISAVTELNKMSGFNEQTVNLNGSVIFTGEDELEE